MEWLFRSHYREVEGCARKDLFLTLSSFKKVKIKLLWDHTFQEEPVLSKVLSKISANVQTGRQHSAGVHDTRRS